MSPFSVYLIVKTALNSDTENRIIIKGDFHVKF